VVVSVAPVAGADILSVRLVVAVGLVELAQLVSVGTEIGMLFLLEHEFESNHYSRVGGFPHRLLVAHASSLPSLYSSMLLRFGRLALGCLVLAPIHLSLTVPIR